MSDLRTDTSAGPRAPAASGTSTIVALKDAARWTLPVDGMSCASCVARVEKGLLRLEGVSDAVVNLAARTATVTVDPAKVRPEDLVSAVRGTGYDVPPGTVSIPSRG
jgi:Cu+-exporting ATPase